MFLKQVDTIKSLRKSQTIRKYYKTDISYVYTYE